MKHLKNNELIEKVIKESYSLKYLLDLYEWWTHDPFFFKKRTIYIFLIISVIIFLCGIIFWNVLSSIIGWVFSFYNFNYLGQIKWYHNGAYDWVKDGFEVWETYTWLYFLKSLTEYKESWNSNPEKSTMFLLMLYLSNKFEWYNSTCRDSQNKNLPEFKLKEIIDKEKEEYYEFDAISLDLIKWKNTISNQK